MCRDECVRGALEIYTSLACKPHYKSCSTRYRNERNKVGALTFEIDLEMHITISRAFQKSRNNF